MPTYSRLTRQQRYTIESMLRKGYSQKSVAEAIGVNPSSVSRELKRGGMNRASYCYVAAQRDADSRDWKGVRISPELWKRVEERLRGQQWSPQQISASLAMTGHGSVSHETIYRHIYRDKKAGGGLHRHLRHRCKSYRRRGSERESRGRIRNQVIIDPRPAVVEERSRIGDWEMDTMIGRPGGKVLVTMVERKSRYTLIGLADNKEALEVTGQLLEALKGHRDKVETMTFDNGKEFAMHGLLADLLDAKAYFAHPYHSWERGLNENTNGLIRQYFAKGTSFDDLTAREVKRVEHLLNTRPRKCLYGASIVVGQLSPANSHYRIPNAFMASEPGLDFWLQVATDAMNAPPHEHGVERHAGPFRLQWGLEKYKPEGLRILDTHLVYPIDWIHYTNWQDGIHYRPEVVHQARRIKDMDLEAIQKEFPQSFAVTTWAHNW